MMEDSYEKQNSKKHMWQSAVQDCRSDFALCGGSRNAVFRIRCHRDEREQYYRHTVSGIRCV
jgi:hypothetical protein